MACALYKMPVDMAFLSALHGMLFGLWPICLIISAAIYLYDISVVTGHFDVVKYTLVAITRDKRMLALILAYVFSGIIEGKADCMRSSNGCIVASTLSARPERS